MLLMEIGDFFTQGYCDYAHTGLDVTSEPRRGGRMVSFPSEKFFSNFCC